MSAYPVRGSGPIQPTHPAQRNRIYQAPDLESTMSQRSPIKEERKNANFDRDGIPKRMSLRASRLDRGIAKKRPGDIPIVMIPPGSPPRNNQTNIQKRIIEHDRSPLNPSSLHRLCSPSHACIIHIPSRHRKDESAEPDESSQNIEAQHRTALQLTASTSE